MNPVTKSYSHPSSGERFKKIIPELVLAVAGLGLLVIGLLAQVHILHHIGSSSSDFMMGSGYGLNAMAVGVMTYHGHQESKKLSNRFSGIDLAKGKEFTESNRFSVGLDLAEDEEYNFSFDPEPGLNFYEGEES